MKRIKSEKIITESGILSGYVYYDGDKIVSVGKEEFTFDEEIDATDFYVSPGFIEIHSHGGGGNSFDGDKDEVIRACDFHLHHGVTSIYPTLSASYIDKMSRSVSYIAEAMTDGACPCNILGAHLEGPYLSKAQTGAQGASFIKPPCPEEYKALIQKYPGAVGRWSYAPEEDENFEFTSFLKKNRILASAGHTNAVYDDIKGAMERGLQLITHLYSCTSTVTRVGGFRRLGVIESAFIEDDLYVEIIADGKHLPTDLIKLIYKIKGSDRTVLITDSLSVAGTEAKFGKMESTEYIIEDGVCKLADRSAFAGSIATADRLIRVAMEADIPLYDAVKMMTQTPARLMGLDNKGVLRRGMDADIIIFDEDVTLKSAIVGGKTRF